MRKIFSAFFPPIIFLSAACVITLLSCTPAENIITPRDTDSTLKAIILTPENMAGPSVQRNGIGQGLEFDKQNFTFEINKSVSPAKAKISFALRSSNSLPETITQLFIRLDSIQADGAEHSISYDFDDVKNSSAAKIELTDKNGTKVQFKPDQLSGELDNFRVIFQKKSTGLYSLSIKYSTGKIRTGSSDTTKITGELLVNKKID